MNTVADNTVDFKADADGINAGQAFKVGNEYHINNRVYGEHGGTLYPISGAGLYQLDRGAYKALGILNQFGDTPRSTEILGKMGVNQETISNARNVYDKIKPSN